MDSQTDELMPPPNRQKASSFSYVKYLETFLTFFLHFEFGDSYFVRDLFQLGVSQEIHNNQQVLVRQNSITTIPTLFPGLPPQGSFLAKAAAEVITFNNTDYFLFYAYY